MKQSHSLSYSWKLKTGSPEVVLSTLANTIEDTGYRLYKNPPASRFGSEVVGRRIVTSPKPKRLIFGLIGIAAAILLFFNSVPGEEISGLDIFQIIAGIVFSVLGILLLLGSTRLFRLSLVGRVQQETYLTGADMVERVVTAQIIGNRRPIWITFERNQRKWESIPREQRILEEGFNELQFRLDTLLPSLAER